MTALRATSTWSMHPDYGHNDESEAAIERLMPAARLQLIAEWFAEVGELEYDARGDLDFEPSVRAIEIRAAFMSYRGEWS